MHVFTLIFYHILSLRIAVEFKLGRVCGCGKELAFSEEVGICGAFCGNVVVKMNHYGVADEYGITEIFIKRIVLDGVAVKACDVLIWIILRHHISGVAFRNGFA